MTEALILTVEQALEMRTAGFAPLLRNQLTAALQSGYWVFHYVLTKDATKPAAKWWQFWKPVEKQFGPLYVLTNTPHHLLDSFLLKPLREVSEVSDKVREQLLDMQDVANVMVLHIDIHKKLSTIKISCGAAGATTVEELDEVVESLKDRNKSLEIALGKNKNG
jgi:hypothetical protein